MENFIFCAVLMKTSCEVLRAIAEITKQKIVQNLSILYWLLSNVYSIRVIFIASSNNSDGTLCKISISIANV